MTKGVHIKLWVLCAKNPRNAGGGGEGNLQKGGVTLKKGQTFIQIINMIYENATP